MAPLDPLVCPDGPERTAPRVSQGRLACLDGRELSASQGLRVNQAQQDSTDPKDSQDHEELQVQASGIDRSK